KIAGRYRFEEHSRPHFERKPPEKQGLISYRVAKESLPNPHCGRTIDPSSLAEGVRMQNVFNPRTHGARQPGAGQLLIQLVVQGAAAQNPRSRTLAFVLSISAARRGCERCAARNPPMLLCKARFRCRMRILPSFVARPRIPPFWRAA